MSTPISNLPLSLPKISTDAASPSATGTPESGAGAAFGSALKQLLEKVDDTSSAANDAVGKMIDGTGDVHEAMIALQNADVTLQMTVQVRNKLLQAYQDVMRMPV